LKALQYSLVQERKALYDNYLKEVNLARQKLAEEIDSLYDMVS